MRSQSMSIETGRTEMVLQTTPVNLGQVSENLGQSLDKN